MATEVPVPRSYQQTLGDIIASFEARYGISQLKVGGAILTALEAAAASDVRSTQDVFNTLDLEDYSRLRGSALEFKAASEGVERLPAAPSTGYVDITETRFAKISSRVYSGTPPPPAGSTVLRVANATDFPSAGEVYVGRGTVNSEGPLAYTAKASFGQYWQLTLSSPTQKFHNINEEVVLGQGGNRQVAVGTVVATARDGRTTTVDFQTTAAAILLDGEIIVRNVPVVCRQPGTIGNVPFGAIKTFSSTPFPGAGVTNPRGFDNGINVESDDDLVERVRKARASRSRGTETSIIYGVVGTISTEESKRVISASLVRPAGDAAVLYIDDGTGYEEQNIGIANDIIVDSAAGGEQYFSLSARRPIAKAFVKSGSSGPFSLTDGCVFAVKVAGVLNEHTFYSDDFVAISSATAQEIVSSINANPDIDFSARTADGGTKVAIFARADIGEDLEVVEPVGAVDANDFLVFSSSLTYTVKLYKNDVLLYKDGREAVITGAAQSLWTTMADGIQLTVAVDGTPAVTYTFEDSDFVDADTGYTSVSQNNSVDAWVEVFNAKIPGITAENGGGFIILKSNRGRLSTAAVTLTAPGGANLISAGMFTSSLGLAATGLSKDYTLDRMTGQIKLTRPLAAGDSLTVGSISTRGYIQSDTHATGAITLSALARLWVSVDGDAERVRVNTTAATTYTTTTLDPDRTRYTASTTTAFGTTSCLLQVGDFVVINDPALNAHGVFRICQVPTAANFDNFVVERPSTTAQAGITLTSDGIRFFRLQGSVIQEIRLAAGTNRTLSAIADEINEQLVDATASVYRNTYLRLTTNNYGLDGDVTVLAADTEGQKLLFPLASTDASVLSHLAYAQSAAEVGTPWFASTSYIDTTAGDLFDAGADNELAFTAVNAANIADVGQLAYFMRRVQELDSTKDRFGTATDRHFPLVAASYGTISRFRLRKTMTPYTLDSLARVGTTVTATISAGHELVAGDLVWVQRQSAADANFASGIKAVTAVTSTTFTYTEAGAAATAGTTYTANLWDGVQDGDPAAAGDGFVLTSPYSLTPRDTLNFVLNGDETNQSYSVPMRRRLQPSSGTYTALTDIDVVDLDNGGADLSDLFGTDDPEYFTDFWAFMRARTISHKNAPNKAVLWRAQRFGPEGNAFRVSYVNPSEPLASINHGTEFMSDGTYNIYLYMPSGAARSSLSLQTNTRFTWAVSTVGVYKQVVFTYSAPSIVAGQLGRVGTTVTANTATPHGFSSGNTVYLTSSDVNFPSGAKVITVVDADTFTYVEAGAAVVSAAATSVSSASAAPDFTNVVVGDIAMLADDGTNDLEPVGNWRVYAKTATTFTIRVPAANSVATQTTPQRIGTVDNLRFAPIDTANGTAADYVAYVGADTDLQELFFGDLLGAGSDAIDTSTADEYFQSTTNTDVPSSVSRWSFTDGLNYVLTSDLATSPNTIQFKMAPTSVELQSSSGFTEEEIHLVPVTAADVAKWLRTPAVSGAYVTTDFEVVGRDRAVQATSRIQGTTGGVQVTGGHANAAQVILLGSGENFASTYGRVLAESDDTLGLRSKSWVALSNSEPTPKSLGFSGATTIQLGTDGRITFSSAIWSAGAAVVTAGDMITIQRVGNFLAYIFQSTASFPVQAVVGNWIDFQVASADSSNRGRRRIVGLIDNAGYKVVWVENANGLSEIVEVAGDEVTFYTADSVLPGDTIELSYAVGGYANNQGSWVVTDLGSSGTNVIVDKVFTPLGAPTALGTNLSSVRVTETGFRLIERIAFIAPNPMDFSQSYVAFDAQATRTLLDRLNPNLGATMDALDKLDFPDDPSIGVDGYSISGGLIGEVAKALYGDSNSPTLFPGLVAVGGTVFISGPNVKRVQVSLQIRIRTGVPQATLEARVRAAVASEINRVPLGTAVDISRLVAAARRVQGVVSVVVLSPTYGVGNDSISVQANEKPFVFDPQTDIGVSVVS
jgi:hypothetical protein